MEFDFLPLWAFFLTMIAIALASVEGGFRIARFRSSTGATEKEGGVSGIVGATLALLAFLLTFTFGVAASRFETRRQAVLEESNAIGTTYLRAGLLPEPHRHEIQQLLRSYVEIRTSVATPNQIAGMIAESEALHAQLWFQAVQVAALDGHSLMTGLFIEALNDTIDLHTVRSYALRNRIPGVVWTVVGFVTVLAMGSTGYQEGLSGSQRSPAILALVLAFSSVMTLIADLDRPHEGMIRVSQQTMLDLKHGMQTPTP